MEKKFFTTANRICKESWRCEAHRAISRQVWILLVLICWTAIGVLVAATPADAIGYNVSQISNGTNDNGGQQINFGTDDQGNVH